MKIQEVQKTQGSYRVKITFECTYEERIFLKMLAGKSRMTLSDYIYSCLEKSFPEELKRSK